MHVSFFIIRERFNEYIVILKITTHTLMNVHL